MKTKSNVLWVRTVVAFPAFLSCPAAPIQRQFQGWPICFNYPHPSKCLRRLAITIWLQMKASHSPPHCPSFPPTYSFLCPNETHGLWLTGQNGPHRCVALWILFWPNRPCLINLLSFFFFFWNITCLSPDCSATTTPISSNPSVYLLLCNLRSELLDCCSTLAALIWFIPPKLFYSVPNWLREPSHPSKSTPCSPDSALNAAARMLSEWYSLSSGLDVFPNVFGKEMYIEWSLIVQLIPSSFVVSK